MFLHLSVILSIEGAVWQTPPWTGTPPGKHPPGRSLRADPQQTPSPGQTPPEADPPRQTPLNEKATTADSMHPNGMHSCPKCFH